MELKQHEFAKANQVIKIVLIQSLLIVLFIPQLYAKATVEKKLNLAFDKNDAHELNNFKDVNAADAVIKGTIKDDKGLPLPGASIKIKGTTIATATNNNGQFSIKVSGPNDVLVITSIGYEPQEITVGKQTTIDVRLKETASNLNEVVVVAFGVQKKATAIGAISSVGTKELVQSPAANISNSLVGRLPGLFASQASGEPGNDQSKLRIRGVGTFSGNTDPLVMVDGIETPNYNNIDPNEIESISILKDASATAVYGVRGANGVLLITTKRGKIGAPRINYTFNEAINSFTALRTPMDAYTYGKDLNQALANDAYANSGIYTPRYTAADLQKFQSGEDPIFHPNVNWYDVILKKTSSQQQHNLNVSGGTETVKYFVSGGYFSQNGLFKDTRDIVPGFNSNTHYSRYNFRSNLDFNVTKKLRITVDVASQNERRNGNNATTANVIENIARANPVDAPLPVDGKIVNDIVNANNPLTNLLGSGYKNQYSNYLNGTITLNYKLDALTRGLNFRGDVNYQNYNSINYVNTIQLQTYLATKLPDGTINYVPQKDDAPYGFTTTQDKNRKQVLEFGFDYNRALGDHTITGLLLYRQSKRYDPNLAFLVPNSYQGVIGRATYSYKNKYLAEFSAGYEGTENFAPGKRFGFFPAYSLGWVPSEEKFFPKGGVINFLKIRGSYGQVGNDQIGGDRFLYRQTSFTYTNPFGGVAASGTPTGGYYFGDVGSTLKPYQGLEEGKSGNPDLTWERAIKKNLGLDMNLFNNALTFSANVFSERRSNILAVPQTVSSIVGYLLPAYNLGIMTNKGFEGDLAYNNSIGQFKYQVGGNFSFARNKIIFQDEVPQKYAYRNTTGQRYGQYFGLVAQGFYNSWAEVNDPNRPYNSYQPKVQPGDIKFKDINGDGVINDDDNVPIGYSNIPEITYGFSFRGAYKGFDFSVLFQGVGNVSIAYSRRLYTGFFDTPNAGAVAYLDQSWSQERYNAGLPINFPRLSTANSGNPNAYNSTLFTVNAQYLRLKNLEVGYTLKAAFLKKIAMKSARFFVNANNLTTWSNVLPGTDPESPSLPNNSEPYPLVRTINLGVNVGF